MRLDYSRQRVGALTLRLLAQLAAERGFDEWRAALFAGEKINTHRGPRRLAHGAAGGRGAPTEVQVDAFANESTSRQRYEREKAFKRIVNLGTGGSDLGPRLLADAFGDGTLDVRFVANVDPLELERALAGADPADDAAGRRLEDLHDAGNDGERRAPRSAGAARTSIAVTANPEAAKQFGAERNPADVGLGRRPLLGLVGGGLRAACCAIGGDAFDEFLAGRARHRRALPRASRWRRTSRR